MAACGGGGGGVEPPAPASAYENVQPPAPPAAETVDATRVVGKVSMASDTLDPAGRHSGVRLALNAVLGSGALGPAIATGTSATDGSFSIALPAEVSASDGNWLVTATSSTGTLRAYVHAGAMRVDVGSEAWVRLVESTMGRLVAFSGPDADSLKSISRSLSQYADVNGSYLTGLALSAAADSLVQMLRPDHAMSYVLATLSRTKGLPIGGVGDIGGFFALTEPYAAEYVDSAGHHLAVTFGSGVSAPMATDGTWTFTRSNFVKPEGQWTPVADANAQFRATPSRLLSHLWSSPSEAWRLLRATVGEFPHQSFPLQKGARQLDARRIEDTNLNFTGGMDEQPMSFSSIERVAGVEVIDSAAGSIRAVRVVNEVEIGIPTSDTGVSRLTLRTTTWLAPRVGMIKILDQALVDGLTDPSLPDQTLTLVQAWAHDEVWPNRVTFKHNPMAANRASHRCATQVPGTQRFVTLEYGPLVNGTPTLALASWDIATGMQIGATRTLAGFAGDGCPLAVGRSGTVLVTETFFTLQTATSWPATQSSAAAASDVVHVVDAISLLDVATYSMPPVDDVAQPGLYWPGVVRFVHPSPDESGTFVVATSQYDSGDWTRNPTLVRVLGPGVVSPTASLGKVQVAWADWESGRLFTREMVDPFALRVTPFSSAAGADISGTRTVTTDFRDLSVLHSSPSLLFLYDGSTVRIADGTAGPTLPFDGDKCGADANDVLCLDWQNDRLVRFDRATGVQRSVVPLGSSLRRLSNTPPDYASGVFNVLGIHAQGAMTFTVMDYDIRIGRW
jgi:hypothetical protein